MTTEQIIRENIPKVKIMQLATSVDSQPWLCTVYFYTDENLHFYWFSTQEQRHSKELAINPKASTYVLVHENTSEENFVVGISAEGGVEYLGANIDESIGRGYCNKLNRDYSLIDDIKSGKKLHMLYKFTPTKFVLFDSQHFKEAPRQEWSP